MAEQRKRTRRQAVAGWDAEEARGLLRRVGLVAQAVTAAVAAGRLDEVMTESPSGLLDEGVEGLAQAFGGLRGALEAQCERWQLPRPAMERASAAAYARIGIAFARQVPRPWWRRPRVDSRGSAELLAALAAASYALAAAIGADGRLSRIEMARQDCEAGQPEEWLVEVLGGLHGVVKVVGREWRLPEVVDTAARRVARRREPPRRG